MRWGLLKRSSLKGLADLVRQATREESFHRLHANALLDVLLGDSHGQERILAALLQLQPQILDLMAPIPGEAESVSTGVASGRLCDSVPKLEAAISSRFEVQMSLGNLLGSRESSARPFLWLLSADVAHARGPRLRSGRHMVETSTLHDVESVSVDELRSLQLSRLQSTLRHACENVSHYQEAFAEADARPSDLRCFDDLAGFPLLSKDDLRRNYPFGCSRCLAMRSSGCTLHQERQANQRSWATQGPISRLGRS